MGTVPQAYYDFITKYAPYFYVIGTNLTEDALAAQKNVTVADGTKFQAGFAVEIKDNVHAEWNEVDSVLGNVVTMKNNLANNYFIAWNGKVEGPDPAFGKGAFPAAFAIDFLYEAYSASQFSSKQAEILAKIVALADFILTQQCIDPARKAYGGFKSSEASTQYWSIDAGRCIPALLKTYSLTTTTAYLEAAKLAGYTFLYNMQHEPVLQGVHEKYYGGFARYVAIDDNYTWQMDIEDLYDLIGLIMLASVYDVLREDRYATMMSEAATFLRDGFENLYLYYDPSPAGDEKWHRVGTDETQIYDDPFSYALLGFFAYEGWNKTCQSVYNFIQTIRPDANYPAYNPAICWPGYIDVVTRFPACSYYDAVTSGILWRIRRAHDKSAFEFSMQVIEKYQEEFMFWGPLFTDYSPITAQKAMANVSWLAQLFLNYAQPITPFIRVLLQHGENLLYYQVIQAVDTVSYAEPLTIKGLVSPARSEQIVPEAGYIINDYLNIHLFAPVRHHDKIRRKGVDYEIVELQEFDFQGQTAGRKALCRRLLGA